MHKRLYRSRTDRWIAGVCGGLAAYLDVDATVVRLAFVVLALWHGFGALLYLLMVVIVPDEPLPEMVTETGLPAPVPEDEAPRRMRLLGALLVAGGIYLVLKDSPLVAAVFEDRGIGIVLVIAGIILLLIRSGRLKGL